MHLLARSLIELRRHDGWMDGFSAVRWIG